MNAIKRFQLLIHKFIKTIEDLKGDLFNQKYVIHSLIMLWEILKDKELMRCQDIAYMFYTKHATNTLYSLILSEYNSID